MKCFHALILLGVAAGLRAQTPPPKPAPAAPAPAPAQNAQPNMTPVPHMELSVENPEDRKMPVVPPDRVVLSVGDFKLTAGEFDKLIDSLPEQSRAMARGAGRKSYGDFLVQTLVLAEEAKRRKLDDTPLYRLQTSNVLANMAYQQISKEIKIDDAALREYYASHQADYEQVSARHILIRMQGSNTPVKAGQKDLTPEEALAKAQELETRIKAGEDFAKLAAAESDDAGSAVKGGDLGFFRHHQMVPSFEEAAFKLKPGEVSEPVRSQFGYHIIKVDAVKTFDDVKADVEKRMQSEMAQKALVDLQKNSAVVYDTEFFNMQTSSVAAVQTPLAVPSSSTGGLSLRAVSPEGQLVSFVYQPKGQLVVCGIRVLDLMMGQGLDESNGSLFTSVKGMKLASNSMECAVGSEAKDKKATTFTGVDFSSGHILLTVAAAPFSEPNTRFQLTLTSPGKGTMVPVQAKSAAPAKQK